MANAKRVSISLDEEQIKLLEFVKGFGTKDAEKVKNILMSYLSEKGYLSITFWKAWYASYKLPCASSVSPK